MVDVINIGKRDALSNCSSATSIGAEPNLKKPRADAESEITLPAKPIINILPATEEVSTPPNKRPQIFVETAPNLLNPQLSPVKIPAGPDKELETYQKNNNLSFGTISTSAGQGVSSGLSLFGNNNMVGSFSGSFGQPVNNGRQMLDATTKQRLLFEIVQFADNPGSKSELEKEQMLYSTISDKFQCDKREDLLTALKDPHGLNWLTSGSPAETTRKTEEIKKRQKVAVQKKEISVNSFELTGPLLENLPEFNYPSLNALNLQISNSNEFVPKCSKRLMPPSFKPEEQKKPKLEEPAKESFKLRLPPGYHTNPPAETIEKFSKTELTKIRNFSIENAFGKIAFKSTINLLEVDFLKDLSIESGQISLYKSSKLPPLGKGLNQPAVIRLYHCKPEKPVPADDFIEILRILCNNFKAKLKSWDPKSGEWIFEVEDFLMFN